MNSQEKVLFQRSKAPTPTTTSPLQLLHAERANLSSQAHWNQSGVSLDTEAPGVIGLTRAGTRIVG